LTRQSLAASSLFLSLVLSAAGAVDLQPVPANLLEGTALAVPELNLYLEAPSPEWEWLAATETRGADVTGGGSSSARRLNVDRAKDPHHPMASAMHGSRVLLAGWEPGVIPGAGAAERTTAADTAR
jgi:hypothetical protein